MTSIAVFLDRDGVICENRSTYVKAWQEFRWIPGARRALSIFKRLDLPVVIITNQSAINRGLTTHDIVRGLHEKMTQAIRDAGGRLDSIYVCPHRPDEGCECRKPGALLFHRAAAELEINLAGSYLIGDSLSDLEAGWDLNLRVMLVRTGLGKHTAALRNGTGRHVRIVRDVLEAARWIEATHKRERDPATTADAASVLLGGDAR